MPLPKPRKNEDKDEFISRCMADDVMNREYKDRKQRRAICEKQWENKDGRSGAMDFTDFAKGSVWGIIPEKFEHLAKEFHRYHSEFRGDNQDGQWSERMAAFNRKLSEEEPAYKVSDGIAVLPIVGALSKRTSFWSWFFDLSSYESISKSFLQAMDDPAVRGIVLDIDSPGGVVNGLEAIGELVFENRGKKPVVTFANGLMASAAYWLGSAADRIVGTKTSEVGSIGVLMVHVDASRLYEKYGIKLTYLSAGKYKTIGNPAEPLSETAREVFQAELDKIYSIFVNTVARNRDVSEDHVREKMANGRVFIGTDAKAVGLVDEIGSLETAMERARIMADDMEPGVKLLISDQREAEEMPKEINIKELTPDVLKSENKGLFESVYTQGFDAGIESVDSDKAVAEAVAGEKTRLLGLASAVFGEEEGKKFESLVESGVSVEQYKAISGLSKQPDESGADDGETKAQEKALNALENSGAEDVGHGGNQTDDKDFMGQVKALQEAEGIPYSDAWIRVRKDYPELHAEYIKSVQ